MRRSWATVTYELPFVNGDFVLLTGRFEHRRGYRPELLDLRRIADSLPNATLRAQVNEYLMRVLPRDPGARKEIREAVSLAVEPIRARFLHSEQGKYGDQAVSVARKHVSEVEAIFVDQVRALVGVSWARRFL